MVGDGEAGGRSLSPKFVRVPKRGTRGKRVVHNDEKVAASRGGEETKKGWGCDPVSWAVPKRTAYK